MADVVKLISTRSFFQLGAELKREKYDRAGGGDSGQVRALYIALLISVVCWIWALFALILNREKLECWVIVASVILLLAIPLGSVLTLILVYYYIYKPPSKGAETTEDLALPAQPSAPPAPPAPPAQPSAPSDTGGKHQRHGWGEKGGPPVQGKARGKKRLLRNQRGEHQHGLKPCPYHNNL